MVPGSIAATARQFTWWKLKIRRRRKDAQLEHFAFRANDINRTLKKLEKFGSNYEIQIFPGGKIRQIHA
jgi:hypothetical protein